MSDPEPPGELTVAWLDQLLHQRGVLGSAHLTALHPELVGVFSNEVWRLHLIWDAPRGELPESLIVKRARADAPPDARQSLDAELRVYTELEVQEQVRTPRCYFGGRIQPAAHALLLLEDVPDLSPVDWRKGASDAHAETAVAALARLHAAWLARASGLDWIPSFDDPALRSSIEAGFEAGWSEFRSRLIEIAPDFAAIGDALRGRVAPSLEPLGETVTLLHGDAHFENLAPLRSRDDSVVFHDWAGVRRGQPAFDVAVFCVMSFPVERRREKEHDLVTLHANALRAAGVDLADPWLAYRHGALAWSIRMVEFARNFPPDPIGQSALRMVVGRCAAAAVDLDVLDLVT